MENKSKPTVLIVDDTETNIDILLEALSNDYEVSVAMDGKSALEAVEADPPDLILLDIMMPEMDGYEVCKKLKDNEATKEIPVIFLTAKSEVTDETRGLGLGAVDYITKPISLPIVRARIKTHLSLLNARRKLEEQNEYLREAAQLREDIERITRHDIKTPLTSIIGLSELHLMDDNLTDDQKESLKMMKDSGYKMLNMINLSLDLFKMERGLYKLNPVPVDILKIVNKVITELQDLITGKELAVNILINGNPAVEKDSFNIQGEELLCYSMLANLIKNAFEVSPENGTISITLDGNSISIHNPGAVPESIRDKFFDKYVTSGKSAGTGLGTYSARLIAETQKGNINLKTSEESGTTISVTFSN